MIEIFSIQLQDKAAVLTQLRKQRGKRVPEGLTSVEDMRTFRCSATHTVRLTNRFYIRLFILHSSIGFTQCQ